MSKLNQKIKSIILGTRSFYVTIAILIACFAALSPAYGDNQKKPQNALKRAYVIHDDIDQDYPYGRLLVEYLGHFDLSISEMPLSKWTPGSMASADLIVYVGQAHYRLPEKLLAEIAKAKRVIWFRNGIDQMAKYLRWEDFRLGVTARGWKDIRFDYKHDKQKEPFDDQQYVVLTAPGQTAEMLATVSNANLTKPLAWKRGNVYFSGMLNFETELFYVLANLLHQFVPNDHSHSRTAFLRIEDVNPLTPPYAVKEVVDVIKQHNIPFAIGVVPANVAKDGAITYLHKKPALTAVLQYAQNNGASIIMHGYTHQNVHSPMTGEGYEFWNAADDKPIEDDENFTRTRIQLGIAELVRCGLTPLAFEPPHYAMSKTGYDVLSQHFNIFSGQLQLSDASDTVGGAIPYITTSTYLNGMTVIPENLGYYDGEEFTLKKLMANATSVAKVQDGLAGFFYHGYLPTTAPLDSILTSMREQKFEFLDLRQLPIKVQSEQITITGIDGNILVEIDERLKTAWKMEFWNQHEMVFMLILITAVFAVVRIKRSAR